MRYIIIILALFVSFFASAQTSTRKERNYIREGNALYEKKNYKKAEDAYNKALKENPGSMRAQYNKALTQIRLGEDQDIKDEKVRTEYLKSGVTTMESISRLGAADPFLASKANYTLGNLAFNKEDYASAVAAYKQSLRLDPSCNEARRNLRIAQKKLQKQQQDQNKQDQNQEKQQQQEKQKQQQNKEQQQDQKDQQPQNEKQNQNQQPQEGEMSQQSVDQILQSMETKENATRQRVQNQMQNQKNSNRSRPQRKW